MSVRVRFAPSPTGPLHIGGVRTALYNYLFAKKNGGVFILRIEDTDQNRYVEGAEEYIRKSLEWCGIEPDEGPKQGGEYGPYRQSERKDKYAEYAHKLVELGHAYYAFDTPEDLELVRQQAQEAGMHSFKYDNSSRYQMKNSISLPKEEFDKLIKEGHPYTIRLMMPKGETVTFQDAVREEVSFSTDELDDKVILKTDGMPTYHLANIVDDHLMKITHVIRGEEWLSSTAHHVLMYQFLGWDAPIFAHLPLILKPTGKGKLSKRDGAKFGFPVFPMDWKQSEEEVYIGFKEVGFLPDALLNFLAFLGWNPGDDRELLTVNELIEAFSIDKIVKSGAKFDYDKAKWYNQQYLLQKTDEEIAHLIVSDKNYDLNLKEKEIESIVSLMKERVIFHSEILTSGQYLYEKPKEYDLKMLGKKWDSENKIHFEKIMDLVSDHSSDASELSNSVKQYIFDNELKMGAILPVLRIATTGTMKGPDLFETMIHLGVKETRDRIEYCINTLVNQ